MPQNQRARAILKRRRTAKLERWRKAQAAEPAKTGKKPAKKD